VGAKDPEGETMDQLNVINGCSSGSGSDRKKRGNWVFEL
jgi:hypothetical protein